MTDKPAPKLEIIEPAHNRVIVGATVITPRARIVGNPGAVMYHNWYSSLFEPVLPAKTMNGVINQFDKVTDQSGDVWHSRAFNVTLPVGSQVITAAAFDTAKDDADSMAAIKVALMAGGAPPDDPDPNARPCVVHVLIADMIWNPPPVNNQLSRTNAVLKARAPRKWFAESANAQGAKVVTPDADYHKINRLRYRWIFRDANRVPVATLEPNGMGIDVQGDTHTPVITYTGALPPALVVNTAYTLVLRVEDTQNPALGHESERAIVVVN
jgi:hypothetical protein